MDTKAALTVYDSLMKNILFHVEMMGKYSIIHIIVDTISYLDFSRITKGNHWHMIDSNKYGNKTYFMMVFALEKIFLVKNTSGKVTQCFKFLEFIY
jgi:hypothetical protein